MFVVNISWTGLNEAIAYLGRVNTRLAKDQSTGLFKSVNRIGDVWQDSFLSEGGRLGGWAPLAESTVERRAAQGYDPEHPILERSGVLRHVAVDAFASARRPFSTTRSDPYSDSPTSSSISVSGGVATLNARGWKITNQFEMGSHPPRPFWFVDRTVLFAAQSGMADWVINDVIGKG